MKYLFTVFILLFFLNILKAQEFGEVSEEELKMTTCEEEPDADAVLLLDLMDMQINKHFEIKTRIHQRFKILTEEGKKKADVRIPYYYEDHVYGIDAVAYSPDGKEYELDSDNIFEEEVKNTRIKSFAIPGVEVGSVIEYEFTVSSHVRATIDPWYFQSDCFTKFNRFSLILAPGFLYGKIDDNCEGYDIKMTTEDVPDPDNRSNSIKKFIWTARNIPSIKDEPYVDNIDDKKAKMYMVLQRYKDLYNDIVIGKSWDDIAKFIYPKMEKFLNEDDLSLSEANSITKDIPDELDKAKAIYEYIRDEIKQGEFKWYSNDEFKGPEDLIEAKKGGTMEKNFLLINMLRNIGLDAKPVMISTRSNGKFIYDFCNLDQFNSVLCYVRIKNEDYFLSTNQEYMPFGSLPYFMDVEKGLLVNEETGVVVNIKNNPILNRIEIKTEGQIDENGNITAESEFELRGYPAFDEREEMEKENFKKYIEDKVKELADNAEVDTVYYSLTDSTTGQMKININYTLPEYADLSQDMSYLRIPMFTNTEKNPFTRKERNFPVDFKYKIYSSEKVKFILPEGISVSEKPERSKEEIPECTYRRTYFSGDNYIECSRSYNLKSNIVMPKYYGEIRKLYEEMASADQEEVVFKKLK